MFLSFRSRRKPIAEINVVPYIDVMLVLLIVFMIAAPMLERGVEIALPETVANPLQLDKEEETLVVAVQPEGVYYLNIGKQPDAQRSLSEVTEILRKILQRSPDTSVLVKGDQTVPYGQIAQLMTNLQAAGVKQVGLVTELPSVP